MSMRAGRPSWITACVTLLFAAGIAIGCRPADTQTAIPPADEPAANPVVAAPEPAVTRTVLRENWDAIYLHGSKVGHSHTTISRLESHAPDGQTLTETANLSQLTIARAGQSGTQTMKVRAIQTPDGKLVELETELDSGPTATVTKGRVEGSRLRFETTTTGQTFVVMLPWQDDWTGYFAVEQSLESEPLKPGDQRELKELQPGYNILADVSLRAIDFEETETRQGTMRLLRIEAETDLAGTRIASVLWTDADGRLLKSSVPALQQTSLRTTREDALAEFDSASFDLLAATTVPLDQRLSKPHQTRRVVYRAELAGQEPAQIFSSGATQQVKRLDDRAAEVTVTALAWDESAPSDQRQADADDLAPNNLIQSDDARVVKLAHSVLPDERDKHTLALELERLTHASITAKNFSQAFATAADVAESLEGDCTEHAVLLAALCRARQIPARVVIGLVYHEQAGKPGFVYHMWTEAWVRERWLPLDGTLGRGGIGGAHIKLTSSSLRGADGYTAFLPVFSVMGQLKLSLISAE